MSRGHDDLQHMPKVDAHHHLWDLSMGKHAWLMPPLEPRMYGDHTPICKDALVADFRAECRSHNVVKSVHMQANWESSDALGATRRAQTVADAHESPHAIVALLHDTASRFYRL